MKYQDLGLQDRKWERPEAGLSQAVGMARKGDRAKPSRPGEEAEHGETCVLIWAGARDGMWGREETVALVRSGLTRVRGAREEPESHGCHHGQDPSPQ